MDCGVDHREAAVYQAVAKRMVDYMNKSEVMKVDVQELELNVLAQNEPSIDVKHIVMQARGEKTPKTFPRFQSARSTWDFGRQCGAMG